MRTIDELGISPAPWHKYETKDSVCVDDCNSRIVHHSGIGFENGIANARLIAAAPDCYKALFDLVLYGETILDWDTAPTHIKASFMLKIKNAKKALAKASGEEVAK